MFFRAGYNVTICRPVCNFDVADRLLLTSREIPTKSASPNATASGFGVNSNGMFESSNFFA